MPILGVGTDILFVPRIVSLIKRRSAERLALRILCPWEHNLWASIPPSKFSQRHRFLAVRWSVKEAAYKALQPHLRLTWKELSFLDDPASGSRKPILHVNTRVPSAFANNKLHVSVSHDEDYIVTMVVAENNSSDNA